MHADVKTMMRHTWGGPGMGQVKHGVAREIWSMRMMITLIDMRDLVSQVRWGHKIIVLCAALYRGQICVQICHHVALVSQADIPAAFWRLRCMYLSGLVA